jgi:hypothetical protein
MYPWVRILRALAGSKPAPARNASAITGSSGSHAVAPGTFAFAWNYGAVTARRRPEVMHPSALGSRPGRRAEGPTVVDCRD